jgi:hypothetical protein
MQSAIRTGLVLTILTALALPALAQDAEAPMGVWQKQFEIGVNMLQSSYSNNWNGGDKGSLVWTGNFDARLEKQYSESMNWRNTLKLTYGQTHNQERDADGALYWQRPDKSDDIIDLESLLRWTRKSGWDPYVGFGFESKFDDRSDADGRGIPLNPMTFKPSAGISRKLIDTDKRKLLTRVGVAYLYNSRKFFTDTAPSTDTQREGSSELAAEWITEYKTGALSDRIDWESRLRFIMPFIYTGKTVFEDDLNPADWGLPEDVAGYTTSLDVDWENTFTANITSVISVKLFVRWVYDKYDNTVAPVVEEGVLVNAPDVSQAIRKAGQFKQTLALGFSYKF